jgi:LPPG:FO 2-phospho-L-lactate transferase
MSHVVALCGGVGGAKLAAGLAAIVAAGDLTIIVNTGDDFDHLGLRISPDIDTVAYTLAGLADRDRGWGRSDESWNFMAALAAIGGETWFRLGDRDLAMHVERTRRLAAGETLSAVTQALAHALDIAHAVVPMCDRDVRTIVETTVGELAFQHYFVREACRPVARAIRYAGASDAEPAPGAIKALRRHDLGAIVICPSNPYLSVDPILAVPGMRAELDAARVPIVAVSPIVGGHAIKGPAAKLMKELGETPSAGAIARHYRGLIHGLLIDRADADEVDDVRAAGVEAFVTGTVMQSDDDRIRLARETLGFCSRLSDLLGGKP